MDEIKEGQVRITRFGTKYLVNSKEDPYKSHQVILLEDARRTWWEAADIRQDRVIRFDWQSLPRE